MIEIRIFLIVVIVLLVIIGLTVGVIVKQQNQIISLLKNNDESARVTKAIKEVATDQMKEIIRLVRISEN